MVKMIILSTMNDNHNVVLISYKIKFSGLPSDMGKLLYSPIVLFDFWDINKLAEIYVFCLFL
jgi:hypothetical protein